MNFTEADPWGQIVCLSITFKALQTDANSGKIQLFGDVAQLVSALRSHRRGRGFESLHPHQTQRHPAGASVFGYVYGTRSGVKRGCCISLKTIPGSSQCVVRVFAYT